MNIASLQDGASSPIGRRVRGVFIVAIAALIGLGAALYANNVSYRATERRALEASDTLLALVAVWTTMQDVETGSAGYLITGKSEYLEPYERALRDIGGITRRLEELYAGDNAHAADLSALQRQVAIKLAVAKDLVTLRNRDGFLIAQAAVLSDAGKRSMDELRGSIARLSKVEEDELQELRGNLSAGERRFAYALAILALLILAGGAASYFFIARDLALVRQLQMALRHDAYHDGITALPNRTFLMEILRHQLAHARRTGAQIGLLYIDLDGFKEVNDRYGHADGDSLLIETARRLKGCVRDSDLVARLGGDEFAIVALDPHSSEGVGLLARRILEALKPSMLPKLADEAVSASIGIAMFPADAADAEMLVKSADEAMYRVKQAGKRSFRFAAAT
jgi:diguanylate cyclase (GGDEF)-like protein